MDRKRSRRYPNISLQDAVTRVRKAYDLDQQHPLDRAVAASHIGYGGRSGASDKTIASIMQYGLFESAGKGEVRVSDLALDILLPMSVEQKAKALHKAAYNPEVFQMIQERYGAGVVPSKAALLPYLIREGFLQTAVEKIFGAYESTCQFLKQEGASDFAIPQPELDADSSDGDDDPAELQPASADDPMRQAWRKFVSGGTRHSSQVTEKRTMKRMLTQGMLSKDATYEIIVSGEIGPKEIDRLIKKLELDREILTDEDSEADKEPL